MLQAARLQVSLAVNLRACVHLLMAALSKGPNREKLARERVDLLDILVQQHEREDDIPWSSNWSMLRR